MITKYTELISISPLRSRRVILLFFYPLQHLYFRASRIFNKELKMVELRKRKARLQEPSTSPPLKKRISSAPITVAPEESVAPVKGNSSRVELVAGEIINVNGFGGDILTHTGEKTTLKSLLESSQNGVMIFTYPKASTPGCKSLFLLPLSCVSRCIYGLITHSILCQTKILQVPLRLVYSGTITRR